MWNIEFSTFRSMNFSPLFILLFLALAAYGQQTSVAVLPSDGTALNPNELEALTDEMREVALKVLPSTFVLLKQDVVVKRLGGAENFIKECRESSCIVDLGKKAQVDYVTQANVFKLGSSIRLKVELYDVHTEGLVSMFNDEAENVRGLLAAVKNRAPEVFGKIPGASGGSKTASASPSIAGGIGGVQVKGTDYKFEGEKRYLANISSDPEGASLSFNGVPDTRCKATPCSVELGEGNVRIIAALEQYDMADTTVSIKQNNQNIRIRMKANFGVLEIKPAYSDGIGKNEPWSLIINGKAAASWENRLSPNKYKVELSHRCYEDLSFDVGINRDKREVFDMASYVKLKKGGLVLNAERDGKPVSEAVYVNGVQVGETPFSGSVAVCARVEIGSGREVVDVNLKHNEKVMYTQRLNANKKPSLASKALPQPSSPQKAFVVEGVNFLRGKADMTEDSFANLMAVVETMRAYPEVTFKVVGHTDDMGERDANQKLSEARAKAVVDFLITRGISTSRLDYDGKGPDQPIASNGTAAGRAKNRRIEFQRTDK